MDMELPAKKLQVEDNPNAPSNQEHGRAEKFPVHHSRNLFNNAVHKTDA